MKKRKSRWLFLLAQLGTMIVYLLPPKPEESGNKEHKKDYSKGPGLFGKHHGTWTWGRK